MIEGRARGASDITMPARKTIITLIPERPQSERLMRDSGYTERNRLMIGGWIGTDERGENAEIDSARPVILGGGKDAGIASRFKGLAKERLCREREKSREAEKDKDKEKEKEKEKGAEKEREKEREKEKEKVEEGGAGGGGAKEKKKKTEEASPESKSRAGQVRIKQLLL